MGRDWKSLEVHARKSLPYREWTTKGYSGDSPRRKAESSRESFSLLREYLSCLKQKVGGNVDGKGHSDEISDGHEEHVIGQWRKSHVFLYSDKELGQIVFLF